ncbi:hypothetical protein PLESTM_001232400 [Pleodorina starrii]|nr:hypothetical protein PLESTM_001232400 [Pleodorina starrii]
MITRPSTLMGSFIASVALDVALLPGAIVLPNTTSGIFNASLTIRAIILVNLPAAGEYSVSVPSLPNARPPQPPIPPTPPPWPAAEFAMAPQSLPSRRLMQQLGGPWRESSGISGIGGTKRMRLHAAGGRVLQQELGNGASTNPTDTLTQGLDPAMTNFTSCLWTVNFNRREASARQKLLASPSSNGSLGSTIDPRRPMGLPYVFLDSVVAVIPQPELDLLVWVWATNSTDAATAPGLADQLVQMLAASRLSLESAATVSRAAVENTTVTRAAAGAPHTATEVDSLKACGAGDVETTPAPSPEAVEGLAHLVAGAGAGAADLPRMGSAAELAPAAGLLAGAGSAGSGSSQQQGDPVLTITGELGRGAQGVVYRGVWRGLDVAVKSRLLQCGLLGGGGPQGLVAAAADTPSQDLALPHRAIQEAAISTSVSHPNVVATYTYTLERLEDAPPRLNAAIMRADDKPAVQGTNTGSASSSSSSSSSQADGSVPKSAADASGRGELEVWKLTLVQELCDGNSLRCCLEQGTLTGCQVVETQSSGHFGISRRVGAGPAASAPGGCGPQSSAVSSGPAALQSPAAGPLMQQQQLDPRITLMVALQAARGLAHLHSSGIVHADVSSANILLKRLPSRSGGDGHSSGANGCGAAADPYSYGYVAKVCDFGLSGKLDDTRAALHLSGPARAVSAYTAPELVRHGRASPAGDVYAFAVVLWELALGCPLPALLARPEGARLQSWLAQQSRMDPRTVEPLPPSLLMWPADGVPPGLLGLVGECLRGDPATRPSARQLYERLHTLLAGEPPLQQQQQPPSLQPPQQQQQCQALQTGDPGGMERVEAAPFCQREGHHQRFRLK